jgi:hypothetical protein
MDKNIIAKGIIISVVVFLLIISTGCATDKSERNQGVDLRKVEWIDTTVETQRWKSAEADVYDNLFVPKQFAQHLSEDEKRESIRQFHSFRNARNDVRKGIASKETRRNYYTKLISQLKQREIILSHLNTTVSDQNRKEKIAIERSRVQVLIQRAERDKGEIRPPTDTQGSTRERVVCFVTSNSLVLCLQESKLVASVLSGRWTKNGEWTTDRFDVAEAYDILTILDQIMDSLPSSGNTLVSCAGVGWLSVDTQGPDPVLFGVTAVTDVNLPSLGEVAGMRSSCEMLISNSRTSTPGIPGSGGGLGGSNSDWVNESIAGIEGLLDLCDNPSVGPYATGWGGLVKKVAKIIIGAKISKGSGFWWALSLPHDASQFDEGQAAYDAYEATYLAIEAHWEAEAWDAYADQKEQDAEIAAWEATQAAVEAKKDPTNEEKKEIAEKKKKEAEKKKKEAEEARKKAEEAKKEAERKKKEAEEKAKKADTVAGTPVNGQGGSSTCDNMRSRWDSFKEHCERTGGWDRPGSDCNDLLRRTNGCVDTRLIMPSPEGDDTCRTLTGDQAQAIEEACERQNQVMTPAEPMVDRKCGWLRAQPFFEAGVADICSDPAARPTEDQCLGDGSRDLPTFGPTPVYGGSTPVPYSDVVAHEGIQIYDSLGLNGLGL